MEVNPQVKGDAGKFATTLAKGWGSQGEKTRHSGPVECAVPSAGRWASPRTFIRWGQRTLQGALVLLCLLAPLHVAFADADDPLEILAKARLNEAAQTLVLDGQVRHGETKIPFRLTLDQGEIQYEFFNPDQTLVLQLGDKSSRLVEVTKNGTQRVVTDAQFDQKVRGTDISYEDLAMRFLYWPTAKIVGRDIMLTRSCWKLRVDPGSPKNSQYGYVLLWIEKQSGALVQVETYDKAGVLLKRFEVKSVQKINGGYILKQMRLQQMKDGEPVDDTPTYLEIQKPKE